MKFETKWTLLNILVLAVFAGLVIYVVAQTEALSAKYEAKLLELEAKITGLSSIKPSEK